MSSKYPNKKHQILDTLLIKTSNKDINTKFSGYLSWGKRISFMTSGMTRLSMSPVRNPQCPPSTPLLDTLPIEISTRNFQGIFLWVKKHHSWHQEQPCPPYLWFGTLTVLQVAPFLTQPSWHTSNNVINMKISGYLPCSLPRSSINCLVFGPKAKLMGWRPTKQPSAGARMRGA